MPIIVDLSTDGVNPQERLNFWCEGSKRIGGLQHHVADRDAFQGNVRFASLSELKVGRLEVSANEARWTHELIRSSPDPFLRFVLQCKGEAQIEQGEDRFVLRPGQWTLLNSTRPHMISSTELMEEIILIVPRQSISPRLFDATRYQAEAHQADQGSNRLLFGFVRTLLDGLDDASTGIDEYLSAAGTELVRAVLQEKFDERTVSTCRDLRVERIRTFIERNSSNPELSVQSIADAMGCSKRYVHALFAGRESVHTLIWRCRLERSARDLESRNLLTTSITTIALSHGFSCPAHFSRMFKSRFGISPRDYRSRALDS